MLFYSQFHSQCFQLPIKWNMLTIFFMKITLSINDFDKLTYFGKNAVLKDLHIYAKFINDFLISAQSQIAGLSQNLINDLQIVKNSLANLEEEAYRLNEKIQEYQQLKQEYDDKQKTYNNLDIEIKSQQEKIQYLTTENEQKLGEIDQLKKDYQDLVDKLEGIKSSVEPIEKAHKDNKTIFDAYFNEDKAIWGVINNAEHTQDYVNQLIQDIKSKLREFDIALKSVINSKDSWEITKIKL